MAINLPLRQMQMQPLQQYVVPNPPTEMDLLKARTRVQKCLNVGDENGFAAELRLYDQIKGTHPLPRLSSHLPENVNFRDGRSCSC
jgi:hypothetical protein